MKHLFQKRQKRTAAILALILGFLLLAGCGPQTPRPTASPVPTPSPTGTAGPTSATAPEPVPEPKVERLVYVPSYEPLPAAMDPIATRFPRETADGAMWFIRLVGTPEGSCYCIMRGGKDASDPVEAFTFPAGMYADRLLPTPEGTVWVVTQDFTTVEAALLEIDGHNGETLREIPFPEENGTVTGLFDLPDGSLGIAAMLPTMAQAAYSLAADGSLSPLEAPVNESGNFLLNVTFVGSRGSGLPEGECLAYDKDALFAFTPGSKEKRELLRWADWGVSALNTMPVAMENGILRLVDARYREYVTLIPTPESAVKPRQEVTMACLYLESAVDDAVRDFNRRSTEYYITVRDYSDGQPVTQDVRDNAITAMNLDIASGKMPDLLSVQDGVPFKSYAKKGILRDLGPWLDSQGIELLPRLQRSGTVDGKTVMVCGSFALITAIGSRDYLGGLTGWTVEEAQNLAESLPDCRGVFTSMMTRDLFMRYLSSYLEGYLDWEAGTASFDGEGFRAVLEFAAALPAQPPRESSLGDGEVMSGTALAAAYTITSVNSWQVRDMVYMGKLVCPGFPAPDRVGSLIYMTAPMALSASAANPEGACAFLRSLLDEKAQTAYTDLFPSTKAAFENQLAEAMREPTPEEGYKAIYIFSNGGQFLDPTVYPWEGGEGERQPRTLFYWMDDNGSVYREEKMYAMTEEQRDSLLKLLDGAIRSSAYDQVIARIVQEEAGALFAGQRPSSEVAARIQERVTLYLAEQNG